jgi:hypothetical protein
MFFHIVNHILKFLWSIMTEPQKCFQEMVKREDIRRNHEWIWGRGGSRRCDKTEKCDFCQSRQILTPCRTTFSGYHNGLSSEKMEIYNSIILFVLSLHFDQLSTVPTVWLLGDFQTVSQSHFRESSSNVSPVFDYFTPCQISMSHASSQDLKGRLKRNWVECQREWKNANAGLYGCGTRLLLSVCRRTLIWKSL